MGAKETAVTNLISVELCHDCPLRAGHSIEPDYLQRTDRTSGGMQTEVNVISDDCVTPVFVDGIRTSADLIEAFDNCDQPTAKKSIFSSRKVGCGAITALKTKELVNGREKI